MQPFYLNINSFLGRNEIPDCDCFKKGQKETKIDFFSKGQFLKQVFCSDCLGGIYVGRGKLKISSYFQSVWNALSYW